MTSAVLDICIFVLLQLAFGGSARIIAYILAARSSFDLFASDDRTTSDHNAVNPAESPK